MALIYKTLFEVKLLHEFYLTEKSGNTIFELPVQQDRINFMLNEYNIERQSINEDVRFEFPPTYLSTYNNYQLRIIPTYSGFKVVIRVNQKKLADQSVVYEVLHTLPDNFDINILITKKNNLIETYTGSVFSRSIDSLYYFTNENTITPKVFPFLTNSISPVDPGHIYQQGELASFALNDIREFYRDDTGDQWLPISGNSFTSENDKLLTGSKFNYSFDSAIPVTQAVFVLKDKNGNVKKSISYKNSDGIQKVSLDFSDIKDVISISSPFLYPDLFYSLEVNGDNGYSKIHTLIFSDLFYNKDSWGVINIRPAVTNNFFNLIGNDGFLIKRKSASGIWSDAPVFEIPVKSRFVFWRYKNARGKELKLDPTLTGYLFKEDNDLLSILPRSVSKSYFHLQKAGSSITKYFPEPVNYAISKDKKERLCFDILVPESDLFPIMP